MIVQNLIKIIRYKNDETSLKYKKKKNIKIKYNKFNRNIFLSKEFIQIIIKSFFELKLKLNEFENTNSNNSDIIRLDMKYIGNKIEKNIKNVSEQIEILEKIIKQEENNSQNNEDESSDLQMKKIYFNVIQNKLTELIMKNQSMQIELKSKIKKKICEKISTLNPTLGPDEVEEMYKSKKFESSSLTGGKKSNKIKNELEDIKNKFKEIEELEEQINELYSLIKKLSTLIFSQGAKINDIKQNMLRVNDYLLKGEDNLNVAKKEYLEYKEKLWCFLTIILIVGLLVFLIIYKIIF